MIDKRLTELDHQIAEVEHRIASVRASLSATADIPRNKKLRMAQRKELAALVAEHERLVMLVQRWTVGAAKPGGVL